MNLWFAVLTAIMLNVNGLGDKDKWLQLWKSMPRADIICFQETHLHTSLEFAFQLHAQGYDFYFSHGILASAGVCTAVRHSLGVTAVKLKGLPGRLLPLDLQKDGETLHILNVYALNVSSECKEFFGEMEKLVFGNVMVLGNFNCITDKQDWKLHKLDPTSPQLLSILRSHHLVEPEGGHRQCFTYHHPSIADHKSRLDRIYVNYLSTCLWGYSQHITFSDHYLVGLCLLQPVDMGPCPWHFPVDMLDDPHYCVQISLIL